MVRWSRWHCPPDTRFEIRSLAVRGRARYLSLTEAPHNTDFHTWMGKKHFCFFQTAETGNRTPNSWKGPCPTGCQIPMIRPFLSKFCILPPTNRRVVEPVTWRDRPITAVIHLLFKLGGRIRAFFDSEKGKIRTPDYPWFRHCLGHYHQRLVV